MMRIVFALLAAGLALAGPAAAYPNGAPWGSADPDAANSCNSCHFDGTAVQDSDAIMLAGLPDAVAPGQTYEMTFHFKRPADGVTGFLLSASGGEFSTDQPDLEFNGSQIRSIAPTGGKGATWKFSWTAPSPLREPVVFNAGVNAANDDASPFGDEIHFRRFCSSVCD